MTAKNPLRVDPTRTTTLRKAFMADMRRRMRAIKKEIRISIVDEDDLGLVQHKPITFNRQAWAFETDAGKIKAFQAWLQSRVDDHILEVDAVTGKPWTSPYIESAYQKGTKRAYMQARSEDMLEPVEGYASGTTRQHFLMDSFTSAVATSKVELLATRTFEQLRGISGAMSQQLSTVLADGLVAGIGPRKIAGIMSKTVDDITKKRALVIARTEIIYAHAEGQLDELQAQGLDKVSVLAEWSTAADERVCGLCGSLEGVMMTVKEARGLIPRHPNCRCMWIPSNMGEKEKGQKNTKTQIDDAISKSAELEHPKAKSTKKALDESRWAGAKKKYTTKKRKV